MEADELRGHLDTLLLAVIGEGPAHGYAVIARLRERSAGAFALGEGTIYPALHRLEDEGLLSSRWGEASGRRRRVYALTRKGRRTLGARADRWREFADAIDLVLESSATRPAAKTLR